jgi:hypothetical protein
MKTFKVFLFTAFFATLAILAHAQDVKYYGEKIDDKDAVAVSKLPKMLKKNASVEVKLTGKVIQSCKKKGCWMSMDLGNGKKMTVKFKDYGFFVPKDLNGQNAVILGIAKKEITDVATLKHYAEDAGKSAEEIAKITKPKEEYTFEAVGVIIK